MARNGQVPQARMRPYESYSHNVEIFTIMAPYELRSDFKRNLTAKEELCVMLKLCRD